MLLNVHVYQLEVSTSIDMKVPFYMMLSLSGIQIQLCYDVMISTSSYTREGKYSNGPIYALKKGLKCLYIVHIFTKMLCCKMEKYCSFGDIVMHHCNRLTEKSMF